MGRRAMAAELVKYGFLVELVLFRLIRPADSVLTTGSVVDKLQLRDKVVEMFDHAYDSYMENAYPADELMPLSCKGRVRGVDNSRGDVDDALGRFSLTLIDSLDTLAVIGQVEKFDHAVQLVIRDVSFDTDVVVSVFETNIRVLGGLLSGHLMAVDLQQKGLAMQWYSGQLLVMAKDIGERLLPAFNTSTGIPYPRVNLKYGLVKGRSRTGTEKDTCTACAGTMVLEFATLSRLTGDPIFEEKAHKAMEYIWFKRQRSNDLVGTTINIHSGDWVRRDSGVGAGIDSYYEYCLKAYILLGEEAYLQRFSKHYTGIMEYVNSGPYFLDVHMHKPKTRSRHFMDALLAFWPGLQVLFGDIRPAIETHEMLYQVTQKHNFLPEAFTSDYNVYWGQYPLRPEFTESTYFLYQATSDPYYLEVGKNIIDNLEQHAKVPCGFAGVKDVRTGSHEDRMDSYFLAETFKYLYLLFTEKEDLLIDIDDYVFTTEAHLFPLSLAKTRNGSVQVNDTDPFRQGKEDGHEGGGYSQTCPNHSATNTQDFAKEVRKNLRATTSSLNPTCPPKTFSKAGPKQGSAGAVPLKAYEFNPLDPSHLDQLDRMGIRVVTLKDGRVQLFHTAAQAASPEEADEGVNFMQDMIEISKIRTGNVEDLSSRVVQFFNPPYLSSMVLAAGPAQFGAELAGQWVIGQVVVAEPFEACRPPDNRLVMENKIVLVKRGGCMFIDKVREVEKAGGSGVIVMDNTEGSSSDFSSLFAMSGDGRQDVGIPAVFLFNKEGQMVYEAALELQGQLEVILLDKAKSVDKIEQMRALMPEEPNLKPEVKDQDQVEPRDAGTEARGVDQAEEESVSGTDKRDDQEQISQHEVTIDEITNIYKLLDPEVYEHYYQGVTIEELRGKVQAKLKEEILKQLGENGEEEELHAAAKEAVQTLEMSIDGIDWTLVMQAVSDADQSGESSSHLPTDQSGESSSHLPADQSSESSSHLPADQSGEGSQLPANDAKLSDAPDETGDDGRVDGRSQEEVVGHPRMDSAGTGDGEKSAKSEGKDSREVLPGPLGPKPGDVNGVYPKKKLSDRRGKKPSGQDDQETELMKEYRQRREVLLQQQMNQNRKWQEEKDKQQRRDEL